MKLYEISEKMEAAWGHVAELLENPEDYSEDALEKFEEVLSGVEVDLEKKLLGYARIIKNIKAEADAVKAEKDRLAKRQKTLDAQVAYLTEAIRCNVSAGDKIKDETCVISTRKSERCEVLTDASFIPEEFQRVKIDADKSAIKAALKDGATLPFAKLVKDYSVTIK